MAHRVLVCILCITLPRIRCSFITTEPHGSRLWFREPDSVSVFDPDKTRLYATGVIVGEVKYDENERIATCRFTEVRSDDERKWLYGKLGREPEAADFDKMTSLIEKCGRVIDNRRGVPRFLNPLFPGTLWCGAGDAAYDYKAIGYYSAADSCCRNHDLCPYRATPGEATVPGGGLNRITVSDCRCDRALTECLDRNVSQKSFQLVSRMLGVLIAVGLGYCLSENGTIVEPGHGWLDVL